MGTKILQPIEFFGNKPNFERDIVDSSILVNHSLFNLTNDEYQKFSLDYEEGHIVWDVATQKHYVWDTHLVAGSEMYYFRLLGPITKSTEGWNTEMSNYVPAMGEVIIYTDHKTIIDGTGSHLVPMFKVGNGTDTVVTLPFAGDHTQEAAHAQIAEKVAHSLHIGPHDYDGSAEVTVGLYDGDYDVNDNN